MDLKGLFNPAIGGYFGLELPHLSEYHPEAIPINSGRHSLEYILRLRKYRKVIIPYYTCEVVLEPIKKLGLEYEYYSLDENLEPEFDFDEVEGNECFLYTNYFGLKNEYIRSMPRMNNIIVDNSQAFFSKPLPCFDTFYSPRKFFGVPDGGYLYTYDKSILPAYMPQSVSHQHCAHLLKRIDTSPEDGYLDATKNDIRISSLEMQGMSNLSKNILRGINYDQVSLKRRNNYSIIHRYLGERNELKLGRFYDESDIPMTYPLLIRFDDLKEKLIDKKIYIPTYWNNVLACAPRESWESHLANYLVALPIDQRYSAKDMQYIVEVVLSIINN